MTTHLETKLADKKVLLLEDEYFLAAEIRHALVGLGAVVVGPYAEVNEGFDAARSHPDLCCAVLDVNLRNTLVFPLADELHRRGVPFLFTTGYDEAAIPSPHKDAARCEKPVDRKVLKRLVVDLARS